MKRTWGTLLTVAVLALAIGLVWWFVARSSWRPPASIKPALPQIGSMDGFAAPAGREALQKPLLWSSRAPVEEVETVAVAAEESELAQLRLMAVLESGGQRIALLQRPDRSVLKVNSSTTEGEWRLDSFDGLMAVFVSGTGQRVERPLERVATAAPNSTGPARPPRAAQSGRPAPTQPSPAVVSGGRPGMAPTGALPPPPAPGFHSPRPVPPPSVPRSSSPATPAGAGASAPAAV